MSVHCPACGMAKWLPDVARQQEIKIGDLTKKIAKLKLANDMSMQAYDLLKEQMSPPSARNYSFDLCETDGGSYQLCINLDALTPEEARKEADEIVSIWNSNTVGLA